MEQDGKFLAAKKLAASFAYVGLCGGDQVHLFAFGDTLRAQKRNLAQKGRFLETMDFLDKLEAVGGTAPLSAAMGCGPLRRGVAVVISDFMTDHGIEDTVKLLQQKKQEVLLVQVLSKEEEEPKVGGAVRLVDAETGESRDLELNEAMAAAYKKALMKQRAALREFCSRRDAVFAHVREDEDLLRVLYEMMR